MTMPTSPRHASDRRRLFGVFAFLIGAGFLWSLLPDSEIAHAGMGVVYIIAAVWLILPRRQ
jgi:hypothetical protein